MASFSFLLYFVTVLKPITVSEGKTIGKYDTLYPSELRMNTAMTPMIIYVNEQSVFLHWFYPICKLVRCVFIKYLTSRPKSVCNVIIPAEGETKVGAPRDKRQDDLSVTCYDIQTGGVLKGYEGTQQNIWTHLNGCFEHLIHMAWMDK